MRGYAFDPSLVTQLENAPVSVLIYKIKWEEALSAGPCGEYLEVIDVDPASNAYYDPVNLNHADILAQNGLAPSEGNPQFHQQMVYAVAMTTIDRFERALGRRAFWADNDNAVAKKPEENGFVEKLRIYPHALRMANAYYSREKMALLFGYFPGTADRSAGVYPEGLVFTCLSHDIIAHETTHALLDGFHPYLLTPDSRNREALAFHEAFADIVALFQHFSFPEVLEHQIAHTRGDLSSENLLGQLATQFGHARGMRGALRDAIGYYDQKKQRWVKREPDPLAVISTKEVHALGAILVAAVFDAFLSIYRNRSLDLMRLASNGTGMLAPGALHPDLVRRLAEEAARSSSHVLNMCIRALDYCPPLDLRFGEFLRALITADLDLMPEDELKYRVAFIEAFRRRGIYPSDVRTLSEDSLRWGTPDEDPVMTTNSTARKRIKATLKKFAEENDVRSRIDKLRHLQERKKVWLETRRIEEELSGALSDLIQPDTQLQKLLGLTIAPPKDLTLIDPTKPFRVNGLRVARRLRDDGRAVNHVFFTLLQKAVWKMPDSGDSREQILRAGSMVVWDLEASEITYVIRKGLTHQQQVREAQLDEDDAMSLADTYFGAQKELFAQLHHSGA
ncbi:MAG: hypothetical protein FJX48_04255 [Alphaproteobacteria bacterium]|nr:hypothetical protein [Alphaproteobacteria bacterium]